MRNFYLAVFFSTSILFASAQITGDDEVDVYDEVDYNFTSSYNILGGVAWEAEDGIVVNYSGSGTAYSATISFQSIGSKVITVRHGYNNSVLGTKTIDVSTAPVLFNLTGGGLYCNGDNGVPVGLSNSHPNHTYQLVLDTLNVGSPINGTGSALSFGNQTIEGLYEVVASDTQSSWSQTMPGSAQVVQVNVATTIITGPSSSCQGSQISLVSSNGLYDKWYSSSTSQTPIHTGISYTVSPSSDVTYYVEAINQNGCASPVRTPVTVTVDPLTVKGTLSGATTAYGIASGNLTLTGYVGSITKWQYKTTGGWINIENTTPSHSYQNLEVPTQFRAVVKSGNCNTLYTSAAMVNVIDLGILDIGQNSVLRPGQTTTITAAPNQSNYQWFKDSVLLSENSNQLAATSPGSYYVKITPSGGGSVKTSGNAVVKSQIDTKENAVVQYVFRTPVSASSVDVFDMNLSEMNMTAQKYDGLGRTVQSVSIASSPTGSDLIQPMEYDQIGRQIKSYLPYIEQNQSALFNDNSLNETYASSNHYDFYVNSPHSTDKAFSETRFETSPLNRVLEKGAPGANWQIGQNTVNFDYEINGSNEVILWNYTNLLTSSKTYFASGEVYKNTTTDEDGNETVDYADKKGTTILKKSATSVANSWATTYYIYDEMGRLRVVLPPEATSRLDTEFFGETQSERSDFLNIWAFQYSYDHRNRMVSKRVPGSESVFMVYDKWDRLVLTQNGNQRPNDEWLFTSYDQLNRPVMTGIIKDTNSGHQSQASMQNWIMGLSDRFLTFSSSASNHQYGSDAFPFSQISGLLSIKDVLSVTYYDQYIFKDNWSETMNFSNADQRHSLETDGTSQYIALNQFYDQPSSINELTIEAWVNTSFVGSGWSENWAIVDFDRDEFYNLFVHGVNGKVGFSTRGGNINDFYSDTQVNDGEWHHVAAVFDGLNKRIFIDGVLDKELSNPHNGNKIGTSNTRYGFIGDGSEATSYNGSRNKKYFQGQIGEVRLWHDVRNATEINEYKDVPLTGNEANLVGMWTMTDMSAGLPDETGNGHDGTAYNNPTQENELKPNGISLNQNLNVKGQVTGSMTKVADGSWIKTVSYYDDKYRSIQAHSTNHMGGKEISTTYLDFIGQPIKSISYHDNGNESKQITRRYEYDHMGRLLNTYHQLNNKSEVLITENSYNELGELIDKELHGGKQNVDYTYNIRGWLTSINDSDLSDPTDLFGMELLYNDVDSDISNSSLHNGNISGMKWSTPRDQKSSTYSERGYTFNYDGLNRLVQAQSHRNAGSWGATSQFKTNYTYDLNGNIETLKRRHLTYQTIDDLTYSYAGMGNQLASVTDNGQIDTLGFKDGNTAGNDYTYDANGNMTVDKNKDITSIQYNHLNLPTKVQFATTGDSISYLYDAAGIKLQQKVYKAGTLEKTTDYLGEFIYDNDTLQLIQHEEGRIIPNRSISGTSIESYDYQYHLKDHLGNVRVTFSTTPKSYTIVEDFENGGDQGFQDLNIKSKAWRNTSAPLGTANKVNELGSNTTGAMLFLGMNKGDTIDLSVNANYMSAPNSTTFIESSFGLLFSSFDSVFGSGLEGGVNSSNTSFSNGLLPSQMGDKSDASSDPRVYLNYIFFDKDMNYVKAGFDQMTTAALSTGGHTHETLSIPNIIAEQEGYILTYLSNENQETLIVNFDDFTVYHGKTNIVSTDDYYPFGLTFNSYKRTASTTNFMNTFQDQEYEEETGWVKFKWRNHQPDIGRFFNVDPLAEDYYYNSPYAFSENKVTSHIELEGLESFSIKVENRDAAQKERNLSTSMIVPFNMAGETTNSGVSIVAGEPRKLEDGSTIRTVSISGSIGVGKHKTKFNVEVQTVTQTETGFDGEEFTKTGTVGVSINLENDKSIVESSASFADQYEGSTSEVVSLEGSGSKTKGELFDFVWLEADEAKEEGREPDPSTAVPATSIKKNE